MQGWSGWRLAPEWRASGRDESRPDTQCPPVVWVSSPPYGPPARRGGRAQHVAPLQAGPCLPQSAGGEGVSASAGMGDMGPTRRKEGWSKRLPTQMSTQPSSDVPRRVATAASLVMVGNLASRVLGLVRDQTIAALFGASAHASIFGVISRVSTMVYDLLIGGALTAALVPVFSEYARDDTAGPALPGKEAADDGRNRPDERAGPAGGCAWRDCGRGALGVDPGGGAADRGGAANHGLHG